MRISITVGNDHGYIYNDKSLPVCLNFFVDCKVAICYSNTINIHCTFQIENIMGIGESNE